MRIMLEAAQELKNRLIAAVPDNKKVGVFYSIDSTSNLLKTKKFIVVHDPVVDVNEQVTTGATPRCERYNLGGGWNCKKSIQHQKLQWSR